MSETQLQLHKLGHFILVNIHEHLYQQKTSDTQEQVMKKRKKELSSVDQKPPKKNRVVKQG